MYFFLNLLHIKQEFSILTYNNYRLSVNILTAYQ